MVTDKQVRRLFTLMHTEKSQAAGAMKAGMDVKTARKYRRLGKLPSELREPRRWRTREDPFAQVWDEAREQLELNRGLEAKALFESLQRRYPGRLADGQVRSFQRRVRVWRALEGQPKEVFFSQVHERYERGSVMITSNLPFSKWEAIFKDPMTTAAAIDRLVHHSVILELNIPSYRMEQAKKSKAKTKETK